MTPTDVKAAPNPTVQWIALFVPVLVGLAASTMLLVDYSKPAPVFCSQMGGCEAIKQTALARPFGIPMPVFGLIGFALVVGVLLARGPRARALHIGLAAAGAFVGAFLLCYQLVIGHICVYCTITDVSALVGLGAAWWRMRQELDPPTSSAPIGLSLGLVASSVATPAVVGARLEPPVPPPILAELKQTPRGQVTVVDFVDFQCPYCRQMHGDLAPILKKHPGKFRVVRKEVPLSFHHHARDAARAECCAELLGRGDAMADELMASPVENLTPEGCAELAAKLGLDKQAFEKCVADPSTEKKIEDDKTMFNAIGGEGLPTLWIDTARIEGALGPQVLEQTINAALAAKGS
jgi:protein-disulfide isomerase/uncharacterized membrane protein